MSTRIITMIHNILSFTVIACATTLVATELLAQWSPLALRFKWSLGWDVVRIGGWVCAVAATAPHLLNA